VYSFGFSVKRLGCRFIVLGVGFEVLGVGPQIQGLGSWDVVLLRFAVEGFGF